MQTQGRHLSTPSAPSRQVENDLKRMRSHEETILDDALAATFPCSDPVSSLCADEPPSLDQESDDRATPRKHS